MGAVPETSNFFATLDTTKSNADVADLFRASGWSVRKCSWTDFEVSCEHGELVLDGHGLLQGPIVDVATNLDSITAPLRSGNVAFSCECYGENGELLTEQRWSPS